MPDPLRTLNARTLYETAKRAGKDASVLRSVLLGQGMLFDADTPRTESTHARQDEQDKMLCVRLLPQINHEEWLGSGMFSLMHNINAHFGLVRTFPRMRFLSIGCTTGFAQYVLNANPSATGYGIKQFGSAPDVQRRHQGLRQAISDSHSRYTVIEGDFVEWTHDPSDSATPSPLRGVFDLILLDAGRAFEGAYEAPHARGNHALLIAQLITGLESTSAKGTMVMQLCHVDMFPAAHIVLLLDQLSGGNVRLYKPSLMPHAATGIFYVVARGVGNSKLQNTRTRYIRELRLLLGRLITGGSMDDSDLDFAVSTSQIVGYGTGLEGLWVRLWELSMPLWTQQNVAIRSLVSVPG